MRAYVQDGDTCFHFGFAKKEEYADLLLGLNRNDGLNLEVEVTQLTRGRYGCICNRIEVIKQAPRWVGLHELQNCSHFRRVGDDGERSCRRSR